jgi:hypothetical protein
MRLAACLLMGFLLGPRASLGAQRAAAPESRTRQLEIDLLAGYTAVQVDKWSGFTTVAGQSHGAMGVVARMMLVHFGNVPVGLELGTMQLFTYEIEGQSGAQLFRQRSTVAGIHVFALARAIERPRVVLDVGGGWHVLGDVAAPGLVGSLSYVAYRGRRFNVPVGARLNVVLSETASAAVLLAKAGVAIPIGGR